MDSMEEPPTEDPNVSAARQNLQYLRQEGESVEDYFRRRAAFERLEAGRQTRLSDAFGAQATNKSTRQAPVNVKSEPNSPQMDDDRQNPDERNNHSGPTCKGFGLWMGLGYY